MVSRTLNAKYKDQDDSVTHHHTTLYHAKNGKEIYYHEVVATDVDPPPGTTAPTASTSTLTASACLGARRGAISPLSARSWSLWLAWQIYIGPHVTYSQWQDARRI